MTRAELLAIGVSVAEIRNRLGKGALIPVYRGVNRVGHMAPSVEAGYLAAVRPCGAGALLNGKAAAHVVEIIKGPPPPPEALAPTERRVAGGENGDVQVTLSRLEAGFLKLLGQADLPPPQTNRLAGGRRVDCRPEYRLTVALDGYRYHHSRHAWEQDRRREREARARGDEFRRYTYGDVLEAPRFMLRELRALLPPASCFEVA